MSEANPTPGPWEASRGIDDEPDRWFVLQAVTPGRPYHIATVENGAPGDTLDTEAANARLIAAAPEMLAALKAVRAQGSHGELDGGISVSDLVETAIAKAEGRAQ